jgi:hypothetical protein
MKKLVLTCVALLAAAGCRGAPIATVRLNGPGTAEGHFTANQPIELWSAYAGNWEGPSKRSPMLLSYDIEVVQNGNVVAKLTCHTQGTTERVCGSVSRSGNSHSGDCEVRMPCEFPDVHGEVVLRVTGRIADPAKVSDVRKMDVNIRAK